MARNGGRRSLPSRLRRWALGGGLALGVLYFGSFHLREHLHHLGEVEPTLDHPGESWGGGGHEVVGAIHVHTHRSHDARGTLEELVGGARRAELDFLLVTDHMPRTDRDYPETPVDASGSPVYPHPFGPDPASRVDGVLVVPGREMSLTVQVGRALTFGLDTLVNPWEGGREALLERAEATGATLLITHPRSPRERDRWKDHPPEGFAAMEVLNLSDAARRRLSSPGVLHQVGALLSGAATGRLHRSLAGLVASPLAEPELLAWDSLTLRWQLQGVAAANHHPKVRVAGRPFPPYLPFLRVMGNHLVLQQPLPDDPEEARSHLLASLGRVPSHLSLVDPSRARGFRTEVTAVSGEGGGGIRSGGAGEFREGAQLRAGWPAGAGSSGPLLFRVIRNGEELGWWEGAELAVPLPGPGVYRVEVYRRRVRMGGWTWRLSPWIVSAPIWVGVDGLLPTRPSVAEQGWIG